MSNKEPTLGPYTNTRTTTLKFTPFELTMTTKDESTHVPPAPCGCGGGGIADVVMAALNQMRGMTTGPFVAPTSPVDSDPLDAYTPGVGDVVAFFEGHGATGEILDSPAAISKVHSPMVVDLMLKDGREILNVTRQLGANRLPNTWCPIQ